VSDRIQISSVMLCHNRLDLSKRCLESYLNTISVPYELIIVNNASSDATKEWLEGARNDPRITNMVHREKNDPASALNTSLAMSTGSYLHIMENDYIYLDGWDRYVLHCFEHIRGLGQLCICEGAPRLTGEHYENLVYLSLENVVSSSVFQRALFFGHNIKWKNGYDGIMPDDEEFSNREKRAGFLVAWPDRRISEAVGFSREEFVSNPDYYIRNYKRKLRSCLRLHSFSRNISLSGIGWRMRESMGRLLILYWIKARSYFAP